MYNVSLLYSIISAHILFIIYMHTIEKVSIGLCTWDQAAGLTATYDRTHWECEGAGSEGRGSI